MAKEEKRTCQAFKTVRFYTSGRYMGWLKLTTYAKQGRELEHWVRSGNDLKVLSTCINDIAHVKRLYD